MLAQYIWLYMYLVIIFKGDPAYDFFHLEG